MIPEITIGAASIVGSLTAGTAVARWWLKPDRSGRHRAPRPPLRSGSSRNTASTSTSSGVTQ